MDETHPDKKGKEMTRPQNKRSEQRRRRRREREPASPELDLVADLAATYTCGTHVAHDYAAQCQDNREALEADLVFTRLAQEIWQDHPEPFASLVAALADLAAARQRHLEAVSALEQRFTALAAQPGLHLHLEPIERYRELVHRRLFPEDSPSTT